MLQDEWKLIYETYYRPLYLYALSLAGNRQDAEDLLQETFVKAYLSYKDTGSIKYWLVTVLRNEFLNLQRTRKKEVLDEGRMITTHKGADADILSNLIEKEERRCLFYEIQKLPEQMKEVKTIVYMENGMRFFDFCRKTHLILFMWTMSACGSILVIRKADGGLVNWM